jgi:hypothetical protein
MSLAPRAGLSMALVAALALPAAAQGVATDRFFAGEVQDDADRQSTTFDGSLTSTTFYYRESGSDAPPVRVGAAETYSASPIDRLFTDLRGQLDADHIAGSSFDFRGDVRGRYTGSTYANSDGQGVPFQSGTFHGQEVDVRELYVRRDGASTDVTVGRQYVLELAATRFDGAKLEVQPGKTWKFILFGGLYPSRISRDIRTDYPRESIDVPETRGLTEGDRVFPATGGAGIGYRFASAYGSLGVVGILPGGDDTSTLTAEETRVFATANGYWRASSKVDLFHYIVADAAGAAGASLTNLSLSVNFQPTARLRAYASINRTDTETLNVIAQTKLEEPNPLEPQPVLQNNIEVQRIAQESARIGLSANFRERFEVSTSGALRRRGELRFENANGMPDDATDDVVFPAAQAADITLALVDRKSLADLRLGASVTSSFGVGNANLYRNRALIGRVDATKALAEGRSEIEGNVTYINSADDNRGSACNLSNGIETCYGASELQSISAGALLYYRFQPDWFAVASTTVGTQMSRSANSAGDMQDQPTILTTALLFRLAYRF